MGRVLIITVFVICASFGIGLFGTAFRENLLQKRNTTELVEKKEDEEDEQKE